VLWWRPHPNTELNFRTKRPALLGEYKKLVADYKRAGVGIYDDTPDLHRAIAWTDAYYGDMSSLVVLYQAAGKPVMIMDINTETSETNIFPTDPHVTDTFDMNDAQDACPYESVSASLREYLNYIVRHGDSDEEAVARNRRAEIAREKNARADGAAGRGIYAFAKKFTLG
jgi:hypothetical protein